MLSSSSSSSSSSATSSSLTLAVLGSLVVGGTVGAALMATYLSSSNSKDKDNNKKRDGDGGISSRDVLVFAAGEDPAAAATTTTTKTHSRSTTNFDDVTHRNFLSDVVARLWPYLNQAASAVIQESVEPSFKDSMPGPLKSLRFTTIDLGSTPVIIDNIIVHEETKDGVVQFDWDVLWNTTCDIQLAASYGVAFGVRAIELKGRMSFLMKPLSNAIPCVDAIQYSFINPPVLELDFTGLANVADFSIVERKIRGIIQDSLASMVVLPIRMMTKLAPTTSFLDVHTPPRGVARVTLLRGRGFQVEKRALRSADIPDVYVCMKLGTSKEWKSPTVRNHLSPDWQTSSNSNSGSGKSHDNVNDFLLSDLDQIINIEAWDEDKGPMDADDWLGCAQVTVGHILLAGKALEVELWSREKKGSSKPTGAFVTISVDVLPFTTPVQSSLVQMDQAAPVHPDNQLVGLLTVLVTRAFDLPVPKKEAASFVKALHGDTEIGVTGTVVDLPGYDALNPLYEIPFYVPLSPSMWKKKDSIQLQLINKETVLGVISVTQDELLKAKNGTVQEKRLIGNDGAALEFSVSLSGLAASNSAGTLDAKGASSTTTAASAPSSGGGQLQRVKLSIVKGFGFEAKKKRRFKKTDVPDIYCIVKFGSNPQTWRTSTVKNSTTPTWKDEDKVFEMYSPNNIISIDVYDENSRTKDDYYGNARISVGKVLLAGGSTDVEITTKDGKSKSGLFLTVQIQKL